MKLINSGSGSDSNDNIGIAMETVLKVGPIAAVTGLHASYVHYLLTLAIQWLSEETYYEKRQHTIIFH